MIKTLEKLFIIALVGFLTLGAIIVFTQIIGLIIQQGQLIVSVNEILATPAFVLSSVAGILGFVITALKNKSSNVLSEEELEEQLLESKHS